MAEALSHSSQLSRLIKLYGEMGQNCQTFLNKIDIYSKTASLEDLANLRQINTGLLEIESNCTRLIISFKDLQENIDATNPENLQHVIHFAGIQLDKWNTLIQRFHEMLNITPETYH